MSYISPASPPPDLPRVIGFWSGVAILIGCTIGSGIFRTPASIAGHLRDPRLILGLWTAFGIITLCGALALAICAATRRGAGPDRDVSPAGSSPVVRRAGAVPPDILRRAFAKARR